MTTLDHVAEAREAEASAPAGGTAVFSLEQATVTGPRGAVFESLNATSNKQQTVVIGTRGSGRTSMLLVLAGRMKLDSGDVQVLGLTGTSQIRRATGIAGFGEIDALESQVTLAATVRERLSWEMPWYRRVPKVTDDVVRELLAPAFGETKIPAAKTLCRDFTPAEEMLVRISLALIASPSLLVVDDFDALRDPADRKLVAARLCALSIPVVVSTSDAADAELFAAPAIITL